MPRPLMLLLLATALAAGGCSGSRSFAKKGMKLDQAGLYAEAAAMYEESVKRNNGNVEAQIGLKRTGQQLLEDKLSAFFKASAMGDAKGQAVDAYLEAKAYQERIGRRGVVLEIPDHYRADFERVKNEHLVELYAQGQALLAKEDYKAAEQAFARIAKLEPTYKDASSLQAVAYLEPLYRQGKADLDAKAYRKAYASLDKVVQRDAGYRDAQALLKEAVAKGQFTVAVMPFTSAQQKDVATRLQGQAITALTEIRDPFLKVVDRENMERILQEQRLGLSGVVDDQTAARVGNLIGAQALLIGDVSDYREEPGQLRKGNKNGFEAYQVEVVDKESGEKRYETRYRPVTYTEYYQENKARIAVNYRLVSLETGEVLLSRSFDRESEDYMYYATYAGNSAALLPSINGVADLNAARRRDLRNLLNAPREVKSSAALGSELIRQSTGQMAASVQQELNARLP